MKQYLLMISLLFFATVIKADIPGYMGLKFAVKADLGIMHPAVVGCPGKLPMFYINGSAESAVSRAWMVGIRYGFMTYNAPPYKRLFNNYRNFPSTPSVNPDDYWGRYTQHTVSVYAKKFPYKKGFIAPYGRYFLIGLYYQYGIDRLSEYTAYIDVNEKPHAIVKGYKATAHFGGIMLGAGKNFIIAKRLLIDFGFVINMPLTIILKEPKEFNMDFYLRNLIQINVGFGSLIF